MIEFDNFSSRLATRSTQLTRSLTIARMAFSLASSVLASQRMLASIKGR